MVALMAVTLLASCSSTRGTARTLPADRHASVLYVALGDSTVEGIGASRPELNYVSRLHARLREIYPNARMVNLGVGGATSFEVLTQQLDRAIDLKPDLVTISVGPNDITEQVPIADYTRHMDRVLTRLAAETPAVGRVQRRGRQAREAPRRASRGPLRPQPARGARAAGADGARRLSPLGPRLRALGGADVGSGQEPHPLVSVNRDAARWVERPS